MKEATLSPTPSPASPALPKVEAKEPKEKEPKEKKSARPSFSIKKKDKEIAISGPQSFKKAELTPSNLLNICLILKGQQVPMLEQKIKVLELTITKLNGDI